MGNSFQELKLLKRLLSFTQNQKWNIIGKENISESRQFFFLVTRGCNSIKQLKLLKSKFGKKNWLGIEMWWNPFKEQTHILE